MNCQIENTTYNRICWKGDWRELPKSCGGIIEVWDQTIGCTECGMNLWHLPETDNWPVWDNSSPGPDHWEEWKIDKDKYNPYDIYMDLLCKIHPFIFEDCHDPGDEDRSNSELWTIGP